MRLAPVYGCLILSALLACHPAASTTSSPQSVAAAKPSPNRDTATTIPHDEPTVEHPGCFLLLNLQSDILLEHNPADCRIPTAPHSTFKIPHAIVALDTHVIDGPEEMKSWDGTDYWISAWEHDHNLRTAIYDSVVWFFVETAADIGIERMKTYLEAWDYGHFTGSPTDDPYWLDGTLAVDGYESLAFLSKLYRDELSLGHDAAATVRELLIRPPSSFSGRLLEGFTAPQISPGATLSAKTGTGNHGDGSVTWFVGHVQCGADEYVFVSRMFDDGPPQALSPALSYGLAALEAQGLFTCDES